MVDPLYSCDCSIKSSDFEAIPVVPLVLFVLVFAQLVRRRAKVMESLPTLPQHIQDSLIWSFGNRGIISNMGPQGESINTQRS